MSKWHLKPKRFLGELSFAGQSARVRFSVGVSAKGNAEITLDTMPWNMATKFIVDAYHDQQDAQRIFDFTLVGASRDGATFRSDCIQFMSMRSHSSDSAPATIKPVAWCSECKIALVADLDAQPGVSALLRGFSSFLPLASGCPLGALELRGPNTLTAAEKPLLTGVLSIAAPENVEFERWKIEVLALFKHVRSIMSFARGERLSAPVVQVVNGGHAEWTVTAQADEQGHGMGPFTPFEYPAIFRRAVDSHFLEGARRKTIDVAIEWFTMPASYREAKLTSAMTVLENLLTNNLSSKDLALRSDKQFKKMRGDIMIAARRHLEALDEPADGVEQELLTMLPKLGDLNRRPLKDKIHLLAKRWGVPMDGISEDALSAAKRARDHIVHRGQYIPNATDADLMSHVRLARELVVRFILAALEFEGAYASPMTGQRDRAFKVLPSLIEPAGA